MFVLYSVAAVETVQSSGKICVLDIDVQGVRKVKESKLEPYYIFISPPSKEELEKRLRGRGTETEDAIKTRLANAAAELEYGYVVCRFCLIKALICFGLVSLTSSCTTFIFSSSKVNKPATSTESLSMLI